MAIIPSAIESRAEAPLLGDVAAVRSQSAKTARSAGESPIPVPQAAPVSISFPLAPLFDAPAFKLSNLSFAALALAALSFTARIAIPSAVVSIVRPRGHSRDSTAKQQQ